MIKKIVSCLLLLTVALCFASCSAEDMDAPDGMTSATVKGEPFTLYVPETWADNTVSGISSAHYQANKNISVSARYTTPKDGETLDAYLDTSAASMSAEYSATLFELTEGKTDTKLGDKAAKKNAYKLKIGETTFVAFQVTVLHEGLFISLYGSCPEDQYENRKADYDSIRTNFKLGKLSEETVSDLVDKNTPDGMKIASSKKAEYVFYVPKAWKCNPESGNTYAYLAETGTPNVTVSAYAPEESVATADLYFQGIESKLKEEFGAENYVRETESGVQGKVAGTTSHSYTYRITVDGVEVKLRQTIFAHNTYVYSVTYTARADSFDTHLGDVDMMLANFKFK